MAVPTNFIPSGKVEITIAVFDAVNTQPGQALSDFGFTFPTGSGYEQELRAFARAIGRNLVAATPGATQFRISRNWVGVASDSDPLST